MTQQELWYWAHLDQSWNEAYNKEQNFKESEEEKEYRLANASAWFKERITKSRWVIYLSEDYVWPHDGSVQGHVPSLEQKQFLLKKFYKSKEKKK